MKKLLLWLLATEFMLSNTVLARFEYDEDQDRVETSLEQELRVTEEQAMQERAPKPKKEKKIKEPKPKKEKKPKAKKHKRIKKSKEEKRMEREKHAIASEEHAARHRLNKEEHVRRKADKDISARKRREYKHDLAAASAKASRKEWYLAVRDERAERKDAMERWEVMYALERDRDSASGKQAYLYKSPAWPTSAVFFEGKKDLVRVSANYQYATDAYGASGSSGDITRLAFGENPITVQEILLASKLVKAGTVVQNDEIVAGGTPTTSAPNIYLKYLAQELIHFNGRAEQYGTSIDFSRHVVNHDVSVGFELPVVYKKHTLKMESVLSDAAVRPGGAVGDGAFGMAPLPTRTIPVSPNAFLRRYGADPIRFLTNALRAKGINELGGSAMGLGDVAIFINGQFNSVRYDKLLLGLRLQFPTAKKASTSKLWAPELGNGGFGEVALYSSILFSYKKYLNPHAMGTVSFSMPGHVDRRVPRRITLAAPTADIKLSNALDADKQIAFGDRVKTVANSVINAYDTTIKNFADKATRVNMTKGAEFKFRMGNMFERFISAIGFLDLFYDFRGKLDDRVSGLSRDVYNIDILTSNTAELEHRIGFDYSHQYDLFTRLRLGARYTFAGMNVPKTFELNGSVDYVF